MRYKRWQEKFWQIEFFHIYSLSRMITCNTGLSLYYFASKVMRFNDDNNFQPILYWFQNHIASTLIWVIWVSSALFAMVRYKIILSFVLFWESRVQLQRRQATQGKCMVKGQTRTVLGESTNQFSGSSRPLHSGRAR